MGNNVNNWGTLSKEELKKIERTFRIPYRRDIPVNVVFSNENHFGLVVMEAEFVHRHLSDPSSSRLLNIFNYFLPVNVFCFKSRYDNNGYYFYEGYSPLFVTPYDIEYDPVPWLRVVESNPEFPYSEKGYYFEYIPPCTRFVYYDCDHNFYSSYSHLDRYN